MFEGRLNLPEENTGLPAPGHPAIPIEGPEGEAEGEKGNGGDLPTRSGRYYIENGRILQLSLDKGGQNHPRLLADFVARVDREIEKDDGRDAELVLSISGRLPTGRPLKPVEIPASAFPGMAWVSTRWGVQAIIPAGQATKDSLREAIQRLSRPERHQVFIHTGWRKVDGQWCFLHGGGALGASGPVPGIQVQLEGRLAHYALPAPLEGPALKAAWDSSRAMLDLGRDEVTVPLFLCIYRGAMKECPFSIHVSGAPFQGKTEVCGIVTGHYGASLDAQNTLEAWSSTDGAIERALFLGKDVVGLVDDFKPSGSRKEIEDMHRKADRVFRGAFNRHGRSRLQADGRGVRADNYPRGLTLSTGEELPAGFSLQSRVQMLDWTAGSMNWDLLTKLQRDRLAGIHAGFLAAFLMRVAGNRDALLRQMEIERTETAKRIQTSNSRTAHIAADLWSVWPILRAFVEVHALMSAHDLDALQTRLMRAMQTSTTAQAEHLKGSDPAQRFLEQLRSCLQAGRAHLLPAKGTMPAMWMSRVGHNQEGLPKGDCLGFLDLDDREIWLNPSAAYLEASRLGDLGLGAHGLWKLLGERGMILRDNQGLRLKRTIPGGGRPRMVVLKLSFFEEVEGGITVDQGNLGNQGGANRDEASDCPNYLFEPGQSSSIPGQQIPFLVEEAAQVFSDRPGLLNEPPYPRAMGIHDSIASALPAQDAQDAQVQGNTPLGPVEDTGEEETIFIDGRPAV